MKLYSRALISCIGIIVFTAVTASSTNAASKLRVVTTLSTFADLVKQIGGELVDVAYIAPPRFDPHFIEPRPTDVLKVKRADLFVHAGLDLELWREPLVNAAGNRELRSGGTREVDLSAGITLLEKPTKALSRADGDVHIYGNPHYWLNPINGKKMAKTIAGKLSEIDPENRQIFEQNLASFTAKLNVKIKDWNGLMDSHQGKGLVGYHKSWVYLVDFAALSMKHFLEPKPGIPPTPKSLELLTKVMQDEGIDVIVQESFHPKRPAQTLAKRTDATVLLLCQNVDELIECEDYISTLDYNLQKLSGALLK